MLAACAALLLGWLAGAALNGLAFHLESSGSLTARPGQHGSAGSIASALPVAGAAQTAHRLRVLGLQAASGATALALWLHYGLSLALVPALIGALLLLLIAAIDIDCRLVFDEVLLVGALVALTWAASQGWATLGSALLGGAVSLLLFLGLAILQRGGLGGGDIKLAGMLGLMLGFPAALQALMFGVLIGGCGAGFLLLTGRVGRKGSIPYAPFLAAGGILVLLSA